MHNGLYVIFFTEYEKYVTGNFSIFAICAASSGSEKDVKSETYVEHKHIKG